MDRTETLKIFAVLKAAYPYSYQDKEVATQAVGLWQQMFSDTPAAKVQAAIQAHIVNSKFAPTIAEIKDYIAKMSEPTLQSGLEAWQMVRRAIQRGEYTQGGYDYSKAFNALPELVRHVVGDKMQLRIWAETDEQQLEQFDRQRFIANYDKQAKAQAEFGRLPGIMQAEHVRLSEKNAVPLDGLLIEAQRRTAIASKQRDEFVKILEE